jgi:hypothetical protein
MKSDARLGERLPTTSTPSTTVRGATSSAGSCSWSVLMLGTLAEGTDNAR